MNRRIKKKVEKRHEGICFDPYTGELLKPRTYLDRKINRKILLGFMVDNRHMYYKDKGYNYQLSLRRHYRKDYAKAAIEKMNKLEEEIGKGE